MAAGIELGRPRLARDGPADAGPGRGPALHHLLEHARHGAGHLRVEHLLGRGMGGEEHPSRAVGHARHEDLGVPDAVGGEHAVGRGDADQRSAAHLHRLDRADHLGQGCAGLHLFLGWQQSLVE